MKKAIIASVIALGMGASAAQAADVPTNEIQFHGTVSATTCDIEATVDGSMSPNGANRIELGDVALGGDGKAVAFTFKPVQTPQNIAACDQIATNNKTPSLTWTGRYFSSAGLGLIPGFGDAQDSFVQITPVNDKSQAKTFINATGTKHEFDVSALSSTGGQGLKYTAMLKGGNTAGEFNTAANYNLTYK